VTGQVASRHPCGSGRSSHRENDPANSTKWSLWAIAPEVVSRDVGLMHRFALMALPLLLVGCSADSADDERFAAELGQQVAAVEASQLSDNFRSLSLKAEGEVQVALVEWADALSYTVRHHAATGDWESSDWGPTFEDLRSACGF
jgi:uncharacterized membrane protein